MAKFEDKGYCPCNSLMQLVSSEEVPQIIRRYVDVIAPYLVFASDMDFVIPVEEAHKAFVTDAIAKRLLANLIARCSTDDMIKVIAPAGGTCNTQSLADIEDVIQKHPDATVIKEKGSCFIATMHRESEEEIDVHLWYLPICNDRF